MTAESLKLLVRHGLTALWPILLAFRPTLEQSAGEYAAVADAIANSLGALALAIGLIWSFVRKLKAAKHNTQPAAPDTSVTISHISTYIGSVLAACALLSTTTGCTTTNPGSPPQIDPQRVARIAGAAAYIGASVDLLQNPTHRPAYELTVAALKSLEDANNYDATALAQAIQRINQAELTSPEGAIYVSAALLVWDELLHATTPVLEQDVVKAVLPAVRIGLQRALQATQLNTSTQPK